MCTVTLNIDEALARKVNPALTSMEAITRWAQQLVDSALHPKATISNPRRQSPTAHTDEEIRAIAAERLRLMESGQATYTNGEEGFTLIRNRYGL
jgi:hypothetical protein